MVGHTPWISRVLPRRASIRRSALQSGFRLGIFTLLSIAIFQSGANGHNLRIDFRGEELGQIFVTRIAGKDFGPKRVPLKNDFGDEFETVGKRFGKVELVQVGFANSSNVGSVAPVITEIEKTALSAEITVRALSLFDGLIDDDGQSGFFNFRNDWGDTTDIAG